MNTINLNEPYVIKDQTILIPRLFVGEMIRCETTEGTLIDIPFELFEASGYSPLNS